MTVPDFWLWYRDWSYRLPANPSITSNVVKVCCVMRSTSTLHLSRKWAVNKEDPENLQL
jgi:hypothetical protein